MLAASGIKHSVPLTAISYISYQVSARILTILEGRPGMTVGSYDVDSGKSSRDCSGE